MRIGLALLFFILTGINWAQEKGQTSTVDLTKDTFEEFEILNDTLKNYSVFFTGENHTYASFNTAFQFKLLRYLHQNHDVKHFMFEQSPGLSYVINKIVLSDETTHLHYLRDMFFAPFYDLVKDLRKYNDTLVQEDKIQVHGIDIERFPSFSIYALNDIVDTLDTKVKGGEVFEQIKALATSEFSQAGPATFYSSDDDLFGFQFGEVGVPTSLKSIITTSNQNRDSLTLVLGKDSTTFYSIIESLSVGQEWYVTEQVGDVKSPIIRERFMAEEFERVYLKDMESKYYGQFGRCHLHKDQDAGRCYDYYMNSIANRINEINPALENQVLVMPIFYSNSRNFDADVIESLDLEERYTEGEETYLIDLAYKEGDHSIVGFYDQLPFVIISNANQDETNAYSYDWDTELVEYHAGVNIGYTYFNRLSQLNDALELGGFGNFSERFITYGVHLDYLIVPGQGSTFSYEYYPEVSNGDQFSLRGYKAKIGSIISRGNRFGFVGLGFDFAYGKITLRETQEVSVVPNFIQENGQNVTIYKNDLFTLEPNLQLRLTLPLISLNLKGGYAFDVSGKKWRLDSKLDDFVRTSFSAPFVQVGASLNFKSY